MAFLHPPTDQTWVVIGQLTSPFTQLTVNGTGSFSTISIVAGTGSVQTIAVGVSGGAGYSFGRDVGDNWFLNRDTPLLTSIQRILTATPAGLLGIRTSGPLYALDVVGDIRLSQSFYLGTGSVDPSGTDGQMYYNYSSRRFRGFQSGAWADLIGSSSIDMDISGSGVNGQVAFWVSTSSVGGNYNLVFSSGNLGVGVYPPQYSIDTSGSVRLSQSLYLGTSSVDPAGTSGQLYYNYVSNRFRGFQAGAWTDLTTPIGLTGSGTNGQIGLWNGTGSLFGTYQFVFSSGNLGIGVFPPSYSIDTSGSIRLSQSLYLGTSSIDPAGTNGQMYYNYVSGRFRGFQAGTWVDLVGSGSTIFGPGTSGTGSNGQITFWTGQSTISGNYGLTYISGNVGIGTNAQTEKLRVVGSTRVGNSSVSTYIASPAIDNGNAVIFVNQNNKQMSVGQFVPSTSGSLDDLIFSSFSGTWKEQMRLTQGGLLGIGTTPSVPLHILQNANTDVPLWVINTSTGASATSYVLVSNTAAVTTYGLLRFWGSNWTGPASLSIFTSSLTSLETNGPSGLLLVSSSSAGPIRFAIGGFSSGNELMRLTTVGLGIGTTNPQFALDVVGSIRLSQSLFLGTASLDPAGTNGQTYYNYVSQRFRGFQNGAWTDLVGSGTVAGGPALPTQVAYWKTPTSVTGSNFLVLSGAGGNFLGVNTTGPLYMVDVAGDVRLSGTFFLGTGSVDPANGVNGSIYYNYVTNNVRVLQNNTWVNMTVPGGSGSTYFLPLSMYTNNQFQSEQVIGVQFVDLGDPNYTSASFFFQATGYLSVTPGANGRVKLYQVAKDGVFSSSLLATLVMSSTIDQSSFAPVSFPIQASGGLRTLECRSDFDAIPGGSVLSIGPVALRISK